jgi:hypothetical protein
MRFLLFLLPLFLAGCDEAKPPKDKEYLVPFESAAEVSDSVSTFALLLATTGVVLFLRARSQRNAP